MKLAVLYDSKTGNTKKAAGWIAEGMNRMENVDARLFSISNADPVFLNEARGVVIGSPSWLAQPTPDLHAWIVSSAGRVN